MAQEQKALRRGSDTFAHYPNFTYATIQDGLTRVLVERGVGRNGWAVMVALCRTVYYDGRLCCVGSAEMSERFGLTSKQIARGMTELRDKGIIEPIMKTTAKGYRHRDRSTFGHIAQYRFTWEVWGKIQADNKKGGG